MSKFIYLIISLNSFILGFAQSRANTSDSFVKQTISPPSQNEIKAGEESIVIPKHLKKHVTKDWEKLLNPSFEEFWFEGNHRPDAGLVLFARNPNKETAKLWLLRMEAKAKMLHQMFAHVSEAHAELIKEGHMVDRYDVLPTKKNTLPKVKLDSQKFIKNESQKLVYYFLFDPNCSHCQSLAEKLAPFKNVYPLQITKGELKHFKGLPKSNYATKETLETYLKSGVPILVISNPQSQQHTTLTGDQSLEDIILASAAVLNNKGK